MADTGSLIDFERVKKSEKSFGVGGASVSEAQLKTRREIAEKFLSGELGVELKGYEEQRARERARDLELDRKWRE